VELRIGGVSVLQRWLFHIACVVALAWPAMVNRQPFYFPDTTAYVRSADSAAYIFSGHRVTTDWTAHYSRQLAMRGKIKDVDHKVSATVTDLGTDSIMAGRSPYFGALLWLAYVIGHFWTFVLAQAVISYALIRLTLRLFDLSRPAIVAAAVAMLSLATALPFFVGLLMPDLLAGFGIAAFLLLAIDRGRLRPCERWGLYALLLVSLVSHLTHIFILATMAGLLGIWALARRWPRARYVPLLGMSLAILVAGVASVKITNIVVERTFGSKPLLVPLLTARFLADGPGLDYLHRHCPEAGFAVCAYRDRTDTSVGEFLWSLTPGKGAYMLADTATRRAMSVEDYPFALAVLADYPVEQGARILHNGWRQFLRIDLDILNYHCGGVPNCWWSLPPRDRALLLESPGGHDLWPQRALGLLHISVTGLAVLLLAAWALTDGRRGGREAGDLLLWLLLIAGAFWVNALLGGGVSDPQPRYQARVVWLVPLVAMIAMLVWRRRRSEPAPANG
jgi:hypothetical protein